MGVRVIFLVFPDSEDVVAVQGYVAGAAAVRCLLHMLLWRLLHMLLLLLHMLLLRAVAAEAGYVVAEAAAYAAVADIMRLWIYAVAGDWYAALHRVWFSHRVLLRMCLLMNC
jgi:hypothetical protein